MKLLFRLLTRLPSTLPSKSPFRNISHTPWHHNYSTTATATATATTLKKRGRNSEKGETLYKRIAPLRSSQSIVPVLDQWVQEGRDVTGPSLLSIIRELRHYQRYKHALEISQWMTDKRYMEVSASHAAVRLNLIAKVHGIEEAENYFHNIPEKLKTFQVYGVLLNCFCLANCVDKAEGAMQKMEDLGFVPYIVSYNVLLDMYRRTGHREKLDALMNELEAKAIKFNGDTYSIFLNAYGSDSNIDGIEKILAKIESELEPDVDWFTYAIAAKQFLRAELTDKALQVLRMSENLVETAKIKNDAYCYICSLYADADAKADVLRVWSKCKECRATNKDYMSILYSIMKFNDIETAEEILKDWEDCNLQKAIRVPNFLISAYCKAGLMEKAEALIEHAKAKSWQKLNSITWSWMSFGYAQNNQMSKAVEAMESSLLEYRPAGTHKPNRIALVSCLKFLKEGGDAERLTTFSKLLKDKCIISNTEHEKLLGYLSDKCAIEDVFELSEATGVMSVDQ